MKLVINYYNLSNPKIKNKLDIMCISDIHSDVERLITIKRLIKMRNIKNLLISGDLVDSVNDKRNEELLKIIKDISKETSIYIVKGNHDMISLNKFKRREISDSNNFYKKLSAIKNIKVFDDDNYYIYLNDDINLYGLTLPLKWYEMKEKSRELNKFIKNYKEVDKSKFNILLSHTPKGLIIDGLIRQDINYIKNMNFIFCGHMHAGLRPICLRKKDKHRGIVGPCKTFFPKDTYGIYNNDDSSLLISGGVTKLSRCAGRLLESIGKYCSTEIELLHLIPGKQQLLEFTKKEIKKYN